MEITVKLNGLDLKAEKGCLLSNILKLHDEEIDMPCGNHGKCGKCRVFASGDLSEMTEKERFLLGNDAVKNGVRLACLTRANGDCTVVTPQKEVSCVLTEGDMPDIVLAPIFKRFGVSIDIGTTTLASRLFDITGKCLAEATMANPQSVFGADVISRMEAALNGSSKELAKITAKAIDSLIKSLAENAKISTDEIDSIVITGNTVMLYLLTETDVEPLTHAPFEAKRLFDEVLTADRLSITALKPETEIYFPPCIAAFIGADTATAMLAASVSSSDNNKLLCDIGTNGEIVLSSEEGLFACSTAAGPAFEGAGISMGMAGKNGAIDHVTCENGVIQAHVIGETAPIGICGSGIVDAVACLLETQSLDETGYLEEESAEISYPVMLTQEDIRKIQLAKSAIHAGIRTLLNISHTDISKINTLLIAGGFGSYLDTDNAVKIGLLPCELAHKIRVIGNAALAGASMLLLNRTLRRTCTEAIKNITVAELSSNPIFANEYIERMMFE